MKQKQHQIDTVGIYDKSVNQLKKNNGPNLQIDTSTVDFPVKVEKPRSFMWRKVKLMVEVQIWRIAGSSTEELERHGMGHSMIAKYDEISNVKWVVIK